MSLKIKTFASIITQPLAIHNFYIEIPGASTTSIVVSATSFPSEKMREIKLYYQGEEIRYPTLPQNSGEWKFKVPESDSGIIRRELDEIKAKRYNQKLGTMLPYKWKDITVIARDLNQNPVFKVILHGAWLIGREDVPLDNSDPTKSWQWDYAWKYQWIEDVDLNNNPSENPM